MSAIRPVSEAFDVCVAVPASANTFSGFRSWLSSPEFPERGRIDFCDGELLIDMSPERRDSHASVKGEIFRALSNLVRAEDLGLMEPDGVRLENEECGLHVEPDGMFLSWETIRRGRARGGLDEDGPLGFTGVVDLVLEVISPSSVRKDRQRLLPQYAKAGVSEVWLIDARADEIEFEIYDCRDGEPRLQPERGGSGSSERDTIPGTRGTRFSTGRRSQESREASDPQRSAAAATGRAAPPRPR